MDPMSNLTMLSIVPVQGPQRLYDENGDEEYKFLAFLDAGDYIVGIRNTFLFRYNIHSDEWTLIMQLPDSLSDEYGLDGPLFFDKDTKRLFICSEDTRMAVLDLKKRLVTQQVPALEGRSIGEVMVKVDEVFHRVAFYDIRKFRHDIWNKASLNRQSAFTGVVVQGFIPLS